MDIILDQHLQAEPQVPKDADHEQDQRKGDHRLRRPLHQRGMVAERQAEQRDDEPGDEQHIAERGQPLLQPVAGTVMRGAKSADPAERRSVTH